MKIHRNLPHKNNNCNNKNLLIHIANGRNGNGKYFFEPPCYLFLLISFIDVIRIKFYD